MRIFNPVETFNRRLVTLAAIACTCAASTALADRRDDDEYRVRVTYADLDLSTPAGAQELYDRITRAAHIVCSDLEATRSSTGSRGRNAMTRRSEKPSTRSTGPL